MKFELGRVVITPAALEVLEVCKEDFRSFLARHIIGDWGDLCDEDKVVNELELKEGGRLLSSYKTRYEASIWIITEACDDRGRRSTTTILLPEDY